MSAQSGGDAVVDGARKTTPNNCMVSNNERMDIEDIDWSNLPAFSQVENNKKRKITDAGSVQGVQSKRSDLTPAAPKVSAVSAKTSPAIVIQPKQESMGILQQPVIFSKPLDASVFGKYPIDVVRINTRKKIIIIDYKDISKTTMESLVKQTKLGQWDIECYCPDRQKYSYGVISQISVVTDTDNLMESMKIANNNIVKLERLQKTVNHQKVLSESLRITFAADELPDRVKVGHIMYRVRPYVFPPIQCFNCQ